MVPSLPLAHATRSFTALTPRSRALMPLCGVVQAGTAATSDVARVEVTKQFVMGQSQCDARLRVSSQATRISPSSSMLLGP
jgi:hypothetical protein